MIDRPFRATLAVGYVAGLMLVTVPLVELVSHAFPLAPTAARWRYGFMGFLGNNALLPTLGLLLMVLTAVLLEHVRMVRALAVVAAVLAIVLVPALGLFALDAWEVRGQSNPALRKNFDIATAKAGTALVFTAIGSAWVAYSGWRLARGHARRERREARKSSRSPDMLAIKPDAAGRVARSPESDPDSP